MKERQKLKEGQKLRERQKMTLIIAAILVSSMFIVTGVSAHDDHSGESPTGEAAKATEGSGTATESHGGNDADGTETEAAAGGAPGVSDAGTAAALLGPHGGKVLCDIEPHVELFVTADRKIQLTFLNHDGEILAPGDPSIAVYCGQRTAPTTMAFEKVENSFLSDKPLPDGMNIPAVLQVRVTPESEKTTMRLNLNLAICEECDRAEYTCLCHPEEHNHGPDGHSHSHDGEDHDH